MEPTTFRTSSHQGKKKHINNRQIAGLSWDWVGAKKLFMCFLGVHSLWGRKKHINKITQKFRDNAGNICWCIIFFVFSLRLKSEKSRCPQNLCPENWGSQPPPRGQGSNVGKLWEITYLLSLFFVSLPISLQPQKWMKQHHHRGKTWRRRCPWLDGWRSQGNFMQETFGLIFRSTDSRESNPPKKKHPSKSRLHKHFAQTLLACFLLVSKGRKRGDCLRKLCFYSDGCLFRVGLSFMTDIWKISVDWL